MLGQDSPRIPRRRLRLSVKAFMLLVLVLGGCLGIVLHRAQTQRNEVDAITKFGGSAFYQWQWNDGSVVSNLKPRGPKWLLDRIGVDYTNDVVYVELPRMGSDADLARIVEHFPRLMGLSLDRTTVTDDGLTCLGGLTSLQFLDLANTSITDRGLGHLVKLRGLQMLNLNHTRISDDGLRSLDRATALKVLDLANTRVTDDGVFALQGALIKTMIIHRLYDGR
jgi:Leucine rich repeat/Leucine Rich repeat